MNFLNIFEDHVAGIFGATRAPFSFKKLAKQAARDMEDQTLVINGVNTAPGTLYHPYRRRRRSHARPVLPRAFARGPRVCEGTGRKAPLCVCRRAPRALYDRSAAARRQVLGLCREPSMPPRSAACTKKSAPIKTAWARTTPRQAVPPAPRAPASSSLLPRSSSAPPPCPSSSRRLAPPLPTRLP